ncbi:MAG: class I SAM-dependent methyltransferase [Alphaproteobacteria bacterium]|nr:class I SAM-dependent methyltransferase [Alphaproteobacteria bacterium]MCB9795364.1 class I SAM-dependent methyltransferase [Alphaproteobacteria bacterium]
MSADAAFWNNIAESYAAKPVDDPSAFERKIEVTKALIRPGDTLLGVGCGTGSLALILSPFAGHVHGVDISDEMIRIARGKAEAQGVKNVSFHVSPFDERFDAIAPGSLDGLMAYSIIHLLPERQAAMAHMYSLIKPGGFFVTSTACIGESWVPFRPILWLMRQLGKAPFVHIMSKATLRAELEAAGFVDIQEPEVGAKPMVGFMTARKPA